MAERSIPAAVYYRISDDRQEDSIERQRSQVELYAQAHGYQIVVAYVEPGPWPRPWGPAWACWPWN
jgi:hypothetical protein